jgi:hypothetical protein
LSPTQERTVDAYAARLPAAQREIVESLRRLVLAAAPEAKESFKWAQPVYELNGPFAYIKAHAGHVNFGFWRGVELDGGRGILESGGDKMAHVKLRGIGGIKRAELTRLVKRAVELNREKGDPSRTR